MEEDEEDEGPPPPEPEDDESRRAPVAPDVEGREEDGGCSDSAPAADGSEDPSGEMRESEGPPPGGVFLGGGRGRWGPLAGPLLLGTPPLEFWWGDVRGTEDIGFGGWEFNTAAVRGVVVVNTDPSSSEDSMVRCCGRVLEVGR